MKLFPDRGIRPYLTGVAAAVLLVAGCSGGQSVPTAAPGAGAAPAASSMSGIAPEGFMPDACTNPKILKVCMRPGGRAILGIKLTCHKSGSPVPCGRVHWTTRMSNKGLTGTFKPNPGNPTKETITASKSIKLGHYVQDITARCTAFSKCVIHGTGEIWII